MSEKCSNKSFNKEMIRSRRRRQAVEGRSNSIVYSCPVCGVCFPSAKNMDPLDYEGMLYRHVIRCSSPSDKKSSAEVRAPHRRNPLNSPACETFHKRRRSVNTVSSSSSRKSPDSFLIENKMRSSVDLQDHATTPRVPNSISMRTTRDKSETAKNARRSVLESTEKMTTESEKSGSETKLGVAIDATASNLKTGLSPVCSMSFPPMPSNSDIHFEPPIIVCAMTCAGSDNLSELSAPGKDQRHTVELSNQKVTASAGDHDPLMMKKLSNCRSKGAMNKSVPSDPRHFLLQTWWRPQKRSRRLPAVHFSIQNCVMEDSQESVIPQGARKRSTRNRSGGPDLKLCCPICNRQFGLGRMGWMTEENMSRHVTKCTQKFLSTGLYSPSLLHNSSKEPHPGSAERADATSARLMRGRCSLSDKQRQLRREACQRRATSVLNLLDGTRKETLADMFLASGV